MKDLGELHYFLGVNVKRSSDTGNIWIGQKAYTDAVLVSLVWTKSASTPVTPGIKLIKATEQSDTVNITQYQSAVGLLLYLSGWTRPDIAFAVGNVARFRSKPTMEHWVAVKRIFRNLRGTVSYGLQ